MKLRERIALISPKYLLILGFMVWSLWLCLPYYGRGPLSYLKIHANADGWVSHSYWQKGHADGGSFSLMEPVAGTTDKIADYGMPSIFDIMCRWIPVPVIYVSLMLLQRFLAGYFMCRLLHRIIRVPLSVAVVAGMAFSLGATRGEDVAVDWIYLHMLHEPAFPLLLYFACVARLDSWRSALPKFAGMGVFLTLTSQLEIGPLFTVPLAALFGAVAREDLKCTKAWGLYVSSFALLTFVFSIYQLPHVMGAVLCAADSARAHLAVTARTFKSAVGLLVWRMQKMWLQVILAGVWLLHFDRRRRTDWALLAMLACTIAAGVFMRPLMHKVVSAGTGLASFNTDRLFLYAPFFVLCAAAVGITRPKVFGSMSFGVFRSNVRVTTLSGPALVALVLSMVVAGKSFETVRVQWQRSMLIAGRGENWHRLYSNPDLAKLAKVTRGTPVRTVTVGAKDDVNVWQPAFNLAYGLETIDCFKMIYPWAFHQFWRQVVDPAYGSDGGGLTRSFMDSNGSRMFLFPLDEEQDNETLGLHCNMNLLSLANVKYFISNKPIHDNRLTRMPSLYGAEKFKAWLRKPLLKKIRGVVTGADYIAEPVYIYENSAALDRAFVVRNQRLFETAEELLEAMSVAGLRDLRCSLYRIGSDSEGDAAIDVDSPPAAKVVFEEYSLDHCLMTVDSDESGWLVLSNTFSPFWAARVNGDAAVIERAYHAFMAVPIPEGTSKVEFVYRPPYAKAVRLLYGLGGR